MARGQGGRKTYHALLSSSHNGLFNNDFMWKSIFEAAQIIRVNAQGKLDLAASVTTLQHLCVAIDKGQRAAISGVQPQAERNVVMRHLGLEPG